MDDNKPGHQPSGEPQDFAGQGHETEEGLKKEAALGQKAEEKFKRTWEKDLGSEGAAKVHDIFDEDGKTARIETGMASQFAKTAQLKSRQALAQSQEAFASIDQWAHRNPWTIAQIMFGAGLVVGLLLRPKSNDRDGGAAARG